MRIEKYIVEQFARWVERTIIARTRRALIQLNGGIQLSGDDSPLRDIWDEICAQQQGDKSFYWSAYEEIIEQILQDKVNHLDHASKLALWAQTNDGFDWIYDHYEDENGLEQVSANHDTVVAYLKQLLLRQAADENNERVKRYLYPENEESDDDIW